VFVLRVTRPLRSGARLGKAGLTRMTQTKMTQPGFNAV